MIKFKKINEFIKENEEYTFFENVDEIPQDLEDAIYKASRNREYDVVTPFKEGGRDWLFEYVYKYQPLTGEILKTGKLFGGVDLSRGKVDLTYLCLELDDSILRFKRNFYGSNLSDTNESRKFMRDGSRFNSLPEEIKMAYYYKFIGFRILADDYYGFGMLADQWDSFDGYMESYRIPKRKHKEWYKWMEQYMPPFDLKPALGACVDFMCFLDTRYYNSKNKVDTTLFVKTHLRDGVVYAIQNGNIENMKILDNPSEAIDRYCAYVLTTGKTDFDFTPYLKPLVRLEDKETVVISNEEEDLDIVKVRSGYIRGKYIGNNEKMKEWYEQVKLYLDLHLLNKNLIQIDSERKDYPEEEGLTEELEIRLLNDLDNGVNIKSIMIFSLEQREEDRYYDAVVFAKIDKDMGLVLFQIFDEYTEETDMEEKMKEMKALIEPGIEELFDWKCRGKFPTDYMKYGKKALFPEAEIKRIYRNVKEIDVVIEE